MNVAALPKDEALNGTWTRPALKALNESGQWAQEVHAYLRLSGPLERYYDRSWTVRTPRR
jgi:hypothetical protein